MHVAIITTSYPGEIPGSEAAGSFVADFAGQLAEHAAVTVIAAAATASRARDGNVDVVRFAVPRSPLSLLRPMHPADWLAILKTMRNGRNALRDFVRESRPDYLFALWALPSGHWAQQVARKHRIPYAIWALGSDIWSLGRVPLLRGRLRRVLRGADRCYADGLQLAGDVRQLSGRGCQFLASTRRLPPQEHADKAGSAPYKLAFLGRWHPNKGIDIFLDALQKLSDEDWGRISAVRICGGGPLEEAVDDAVALLQRDSRPVELGGYLDKLEAAELIAWADYLVLPSRIESIPVIFSDAVQLRTPMVATPVGDLPELHDKYQFGVLAAAANTGALVHAISAALEEDASAFQPGLDAAAADFKLADIASRFIDEIGQTSA